MTEAVVNTLKNIQQELLDPKEISASDRRACVAYLRQEGYTQEEIAAIFKVHRRTILRDEKTFRIEAAKLVDDIDVNSVAGSHIAWANHLRAKSQLTAPPTLTAKSLSYIVLISTPVESDPCCRPRPPPPPCGLEKRFVLCGSPHQAATRIHALVVGEVMGVRIACEDIRD